MADSLSDPFSEVTVGTRTNAVVPTNFLQRVQRVGKGVTEYRCCTFDKQVGLMGHGITPQLVEPSNCDIFIAPRMHSPSADVRNYVSGRLLAEFHSGRSLP
ncbi:hypothetical protein [Gemmobacter denitrificans]|uniref:LysR substrate binding domain-containing protein n=1 Tax=Gemmobacter denitrificans TaxID=3123040 RepID=A0ABU8BY22_9RHOB